MESTSLVSVLKVILLDRRLIAAFVAVLLYLNFIFYIARYRKKKKAPSKGRVVRAPKVAAPADEGAENADSGESEF